MVLSLLDTDILSEILKGKDPVVVGKAAEYLSQHPSFTLSAITVYEVVRGLKAKIAMRQLQQFRTFCQHTTVLDIHLDVLELAADLWVQADRTGHPKNDADLLIAATALFHRRTLVTANVSHFDWIPGLVVDNWRQP